MPVVLPIPPIPTLSKDIFMAYKSADVFFLNNIFYRLFGIFFDDFPNYWQMNV